MKRICVDMDEVMADTLAEHLRRYNQAFDDAVTVDELPGRVCGRLRPWIGRGSCGRFWMPRIFLRTWL